ncbi:MAG: redoxin family protein [Verrucomicrobiota bacterium]
MRASFLAFAVLLVLSSEGLPNDKPLANVWIFTAIDCPIANGYSPELNRIRKEFSSKAIDFTLVYPEPTLTVSQIEAHLSEYELSFDFHHDKNHERVAASGVTVTPEVAVFAETGQLVYRGRIDNRYSEYGDRKNTATETYLRDVLQKLLSGTEVEFSETEPIGCFIEALATN